MMTKRLITIIILSHILLAGCSQRAESPAKYDAQLSESNFQTRSGGGAVPTSSALAGQNQPQSISRIEGYGDIIQSILTTPGPVILIENVNQYNNCLISDYPISIITRSYSRFDSEQGTDIKIDYIQLSNYHDPQLQRDLNDLFKEYAYLACAHLGWPPDVDSRYSLQIVQTPVIYENYLSVITWTDCSISKFHPWCSLIGLVIDIKTGERVELKNHMVIDERIKDKIYAGDFKNDRFSHEECLDMQLYDQLYDSILYDIDRSGNFYLTERGIVFVIGVSHIMGDYMTFEVSYDDLDELWITGMNF